MNVRIHHFDIAVQQAVQAWPSEWHDSMSMLSTVGQPAIMIGVLVGLTLWGFVRHRKRLVVATMLAGAVIAGGFLLKYIIGRDRPPGALADSTVLDIYSFPSGHALSAAVVLGLLAYLLWQILPRLWAYMTAVVLGLGVMAISLSRIYLGVHYPTDVLAGSALGLLSLWAIIWYIKPRL